MIQLKKATDAKVLMVNRKNDEGEPDPEKMKLKFRIVIKNIEMHIKRLCLNVSIQEKIDQMIKEKPLRYFYNRLQVFEQLVPSQTLFFESNALFTGETVF